MSGIVVTNLVKSFGSGDARTIVLNGVNFAADAGKMTFLVGPSGCGKTTLISIIAAMLSADSGGVNVFGTNPLELRPRDVVRFRGETVGFVFQQFNLLPSLDAAENAAVPLIVQGMSPAKARRKACDMLALLGLSASVSKFPSQLSGGQQQRVAIARALIHEPKLIVCDEPTSSLDAASGRTVMELFSSLAVKPGRAAIVVTHDDRIYSFADRIAFMEDGRVVRTEDKVRFQTTLQETH
jgi:putative ABC transport system ATP-binding protein